MNRRKGFTLAELLVVVAIIGVLVAVAIPVFSAQQEKSRAAVCAANRRSLKGELATSFMADGTLPDGFTLSGTTVTLGDAPAKEYVCPDGGTITATVSSVGTVNVNCTKHSADLGNADTMKTLEEFLETYNNSRLDSGASKYEGSSTSSFLADLKEQGLDLEALGAKSWSYQSSNGGKAIYYTSIDISNSNVEDTVPVMKYSFSGSGKENGQQVEYAGRYSVWMMTVSEGDTAASNGVKFNKLNSTTKMLLGGTTDYNAAKAAYDKALAEYNSKL